MKQGNRGEQGQSMQVLWAMLSIFAFVVREIARLCVFKQVGKGQEK